MAERAKDPVWLNVSDWQVKPITKKNKEGEEYEKFLITLSNPDSKDNYSTIEVDKVIKNEGKRYSVVLDRHKVYNERLVKSIEPKALLDKKGEPVINPKTGEQYDKKNYSYVSITGGAIAEREQQRYDDWKKSQGLSDRTPQDNSGIEKPDEVVDFDKAAIAPDDLDGIGPDELFRDDR